MLNVDSTVSKDQSSDWWKNLSENKNEILPNMKEANRTTENLNEEESGDSDISIKRQKIFVNHKQKDQKSRFSKAFNLNTGERNQTVNVSKQTLESRELENQLTEERSFLVSPLNKETKQSRKHRKTKSLFTNKREKRKYSDAFKVTDKNEAQAPEDQVAESEYSKEDNIEQEKVQKTLFEVKRKDKRYSEAFLDPRCDEVQLSEIGDSTSGANEISVDTVKESLFNVNRGKKKYSEAFLYEYTEKKDDSFNPNRNSITHDSNSYEKESIVEKSEDTSTNKSEEIPKTEIKVALFKADVENKRYSEAFALTTNIIVENDEKDEQIMEENQSQRNASNITNTSMKGKKISLHKNLASTPIKEVNIVRRSLRSSSSKNKKNNEIFQIETDSDLSNEEYNIEEIKTQKQVASIKNKNIKTRNTRSSSELLRNKTLQDSISNEEYNIEDIKSQKDEAETNDKNINFKTRNSKSLGRTRSQILLNNDSPRAAQVINETSVSTHNSKNDITRKNIQSFNENSKSKKNLSQSNIKSKKYSEAFLHTESEESVKLKNQNEVKEHAQILINSLSENIEVDQAITESSQKNNSKQKLSLKSTNTKYSETFLELNTYVPQPVESEKNNKISLEKVDSENYEIEKNVQNEVNNTKYSAISSINISDEIKHPLFRPKAGRNSNYSKSVQNTNNEIDVTLNQEVLQKVTSDKIQKITSKRISLHSTSPAESGISKFFDESLISSTKLFNYPNEQKSADSDEWLKKKSSKPISVLPDKSNMNDEDYHIVKFKDNLRTPQSLRRTSRTKLRNSKLITIIPENENQLIEENEKLPSKVEDKSSVLKTDKILKTKSPKNINLVNIEHEDLENRAQLNKYLDNIKTNEDFIHNKKKSIKSSKKSKTQTTSHHGTGSESYNDVFGSDGERSIGNLTDDNAKVLDNNNKSKSVKSTPLNTSNVEKKIIDGRTKKSIIDKSSASKNETKSKSNVNNDESTSTKSSKTKSFLRNSKKSKKTITDVEMDENQTLKSLTPISLSSMSTQNQQSTKSNVLERVESSISGIITLNSSVSKKTDLNWVSMNINSGGPAELQNLNLEYEPSIAMNKLFNKTRESSPYTEKEQLERMNLIRKAFTGVPHKKQEKSLQPALNKKITDFFTRQAGSKSIQPKTNKVQKKVSRPICSARLINGKPYHPKPLFRGERWCSPRFYKLIQNKIRNKCGDDTKNESENIMKGIVQSVKTVIKAKKYPKEEVDRLKKELARHGIISTTYEFFCFCLDYLPPEYHNLTVPCTQAYTSEPTVPCNQDEVFKKIEF